MLKKLLGATIVAATQTFAPAAWADTEIVIQFPYPELFAETHKQLTAEFAKVRPDIKLSYRAPYASYEEGTQKILREAVTKQLPDVTFQGLNRVRILVDRGIAVPMELNELTTCPPIRSTIEADSPL